MLKEEQLSSPNRVNSYNLMFWTHVEKDYYFFSKFLYTLAFIVKIKLNYLIVPPCFKQRKIWRYYNRDVRFYVPSVELNLFLHIKKKQIFLYLFYGFSAIL